MKAKINARGRLEIERSGKMKYQSCPFISLSVGEVGYCGHWCPMFHEPIAEDDGGIFIELCHAEYYFNSGDFIDERGQ